MVYQKAISYLQSFINYEGLSNYPYKNSFKLERIKSFLEFIGNPQKELRVIHVAGTKGKGSVCAFIAYILREAGLRVGLYTSPHLSDFRERIRILSAFVRHPPKNWRMASAKLCGGRHKSWRTSADARRDFQRRRADFEGMISKKEICNLVVKLKPSIDKFNKTSKFAALTFFEVYTALAFQYFKDRRVDFAVLETGLGGRLDATNVCSSLLSVITPISYEHTKLLGKTLREIASEKTSIIKKENKRALNGKIIALTSKQNKEAMYVIEKIAKKNNALLLKEGIDFKSINFKINLLGQHQISNASLAATAVRALKFYNIMVSKKAIRDGLRKCRWPARFEIISKNPLIILDGAQNAASVKALAKTIKPDRHSPSQNLTGRALSSFLPAGRQADSPFYLPLKRDPAKGGKKGWVVSESAYLVPRPFSERAESEFSPKANLFQNNGIEIPIRQNYPKRRIWVIFGISKDKEIEDTCREIAKISNRIILTKSNNPRASRPKDLVKYFFKHNNIQLTDSTDEALKIARSCVDKNDVIVITGSLYICGEIRGKLKRMI